LRRPQRAGRAIIAHRLAFALGFGFGFAAPRRHAISSAARSRPVERGERRARPALSAPGVVDRSEGVGPDGAFERLFLGSEPEVRCQFVRGELCESNSDLERAAIEVLYSLLRYARERQGDLAEFGGIGHPLAPRRWGSR
jgi:hypothetical protein